MVFLLKTVHLSIGPHALTEETWPIVIIVIFWLRLQVFLCVWYPTTFTCKNARERFPLVLCTLKNKKNTVSVPLTSICSCLESTNGPSCGRETRNRKTRQNTESWEDCLPHKYTPDSVYVSFSGNSVMDSVCFMMEQQGRLYQQADIRTIPDNNID